MSAITELRKSIAEIEETVDKIQTGLHLQHQQIGLAVEMIELIRKSHAESSPKNFGEWSLLVFTFVSVSYTVFSAARILAGYFIN